MSPRNPMNARKQRIDDLAASSVIVDDAAVDEAPGVSLIASAWRRLRRDPVFLLGATITGLFIIVAIIAPWIAPHDPGRSPAHRPGQPATVQPHPGASGRPPRCGRPGRDLLSRLIVGSRQTLLVGVAATLLGLFGGLVLGILAGCLRWCRRRVRHARGRRHALDPLAPARRLPSRRWHVSPASGRSSSPSRWCRSRSSPKLLRGSMLAQRSSDHVLAARALGVKRSAIIFRHMVPNSLGPVIVQSTLVLATSIIDAAALSFLGLGNPDDAKPEWGQMLGQAQVYIQDYLHLAVYPALCIVFVALGFTLMGESLREALDPKSRR